MTNDRGDGRLLAISDMHVEMPENRDFVAALRAERSGDWLIVAGDVGELMADVEWALGELSERFAHVIWVPGNHELWTRSDDPRQARGVARYEQLVGYCRELGVTTPEDEYPLWRGAAEPIAIAPLFTLYDYSLGRAIGAADKHESLARARAAGVVCSDEMLLSPAPYGSIDEWCRQRLALTESRLERIAHPTILVSHFPLLPELTAPLRYPEFAQWCGTVRTADWHRRFRAVAAVYGHLHIPRTSVHDGVWFDEVSLGYPRERRRARRHPPGPRVIAPEATFAC